MTDAPKLLTEAQAIALHTVDRDEYVTALRERGLIAPEPVDPLRLDALEVAAQSFALQGDEVTAREIRSGAYNHEVDDLTTLPGLALAALKRGMELRDAEVERLRHALKMISIVDQGCGGTLTFEEMAASAMRQAKDALTKGTDHA